MAKGCLCVCGGGGDTLFLLSYTTYYDVSHMVVAD